MEMKTVVVVEGSHFFFEEGIEVEEEGFPKVALGEQVHNRTYIPIGNGNLDLIKDGRIYEGFILFDNKRHGKPFIVRDKSKKKNKGIICLVRVPLSYKSEEFRILGRYTRVVACDIKSKCVEVLNVMFSPLSILSIHLENKEERYYITSDGKEINSGTYLGNSLRLNFYCMRRFLLTSPNIED